MLLITLMINYIIGKWNNLIERTKHKNEIEIDIGRNVKIIIDLSNVTHGINVPIALGYNTASRMLKIPSNQQTNLSRPRPQPPCGFAPYFLTSVYQ